MTQQSSSTDTLPTVRYDSNPFTATWNGVRKLVHSNGQTVIALSLFNILLFTLAFLTIGVVMVAFVAYIFKHAPASTMDASIDSTIANFLNSLSDGGIYATWGIGVVLCIFLFALIQSLQLHLTIAAARKVSLKFGGLFKASIKSTLPILGFMSLLTLAMLALVILISMLAVALSFGAIIIGFVALIALIYVGLRLSYTTYAIVDLGLGPIDAMKHSWKISRDHLIETVGASAVTGLILTIPSIIMQALTRVTQDAPLLTGIFGILDMLLLVALTIFAGMAVAERYVQLQAVSTGKATATQLSSFNYLAIGGVIVLGALLNALTPTPESSSADPFQQTVDQMLVPPSGEYGTDEDGGIYRVN